MKALDNLNGVQRGQIEAALKKKRAALKEKARDLLSLIHSLPVSGEVPVRIKDRSVVTIGRPADFSEEEKARLREAIQKLIPWRKGPFELFGERIDAEWQSDIKWKWILKALPPLEGKALLDLGCNNGYYLFRALEHGPRVAIGMDPVFSYALQFELLNHFIHSDTIAFTLFGYEQLSWFEKTFDVALCLGIIYHHPDPISIFRNLHRSLKAGGRLIVESLGIPGSESTALFPSGKYAGAKGIWFIPTAGCLENWLRRSGFQKTRIFHTHPLTIEEQKRTAYCPFSSLEDALNPDSPGQTREGYPNPLRLYAVAEK